MNYLIWKINEKVKLIIEKNYLKKSKKKELLKKIIIKSC